MFSHDSSLQFVKVGSFVLLASLLQILTRIAFLFVYEFRQHQGRLFYYKMSLFRDIQNRERPTPTTTAVDFDPM